MAVVCRLPNPADLGSQAPSRRVGLVVEGVHPERRGGSVILALPLSGSERQGLA
jgi:hypothetical protein